MQRLGGRSDWPSLLFCSFFVALHNSKLLLVDVFISPPHLTTPHPHPHQKTLPEFVVAIYCTHTQNLAL